MSEAPGRNSTYYVMTCEGVYPAAVVRRVTELAGGPWMDGRLITEPVPNPMRFEVRPEYPGVLKPMYEGAVLLMRDDLIDVLRETGVDNLQLFPSIVADQAKKLELTNYKAVNIVGTIACADMGASALMGTSDSDMIDVDFDSLVIDEERAGGALLFRLAEAVSAIIVHDQVRLRVEARIEGMTFYGPGEWSG
jgi:hypothetical protein